MKFYCITKTCLYKFDPLQSHFYIVKLGFTGVYIIFLILLNNINNGEAVLTSTHNLCFEQKYEKYRGFYLKIFEFLEVKSSICLNRRVFVMVKTQLQRDLHSMRFGYCVMSVTEPAVQMYHVTYMTLHLTPYN